MRVVLIFALIFASVALLFGSVLLLRAHEHRHSQRQPHPHHRKLTPANTAPPTRSLSSNATLPSLLALSGGSVLHEDDAVAAAAVDERFTWFVFDFFISSYVLVFFRTVFVSFFFF